MTNHNVTPAEVLKRFIDRDNKDQETFAQAVESKTKTEQEAMIELLNSRVKNLCAICAYTLEVLEAKK